MKLKSPYIPFLVLVLLLLQTGCKNPPPVEVKILNKETGEPLVDAKVYIRKKLVGTSNAYGECSIVTKYRKNVFLTVKKKNFFSRKFKADNLGNVDKIKLQQKRDYASTKYGSRNVSVSRSAETIEYNEFLDKLKKVDVSSLPAGCGYKDGVYDREASFPGGAKGLNEFIATNIQYPEQSIDMDEQGKVYLSFIVDARGRVSEVKVEKGVSRNLDREAKRVLRTMPRWHPAYCNGRSLSTRCRLPIVFTLN